jgi:hypothetical protein
MKALDWEPSVNAAQIGVTVQRGVITLAGRVGTLREKWIRPCARRLATGPPRPAVCRRRGSFARPASCARSCSIAGLCTPTSRRSRPGPPRNRPPPAQLDHRVLGATTEYRHFEGDGSHRVGQ